jgi:hypothetical protein
MGRVDQVHRVVGQETRSPFTHASKKGSHMPTDAARMHAAFDVGCKHSDAMLPFAYVPHGRHFRSSSGWGKFGFFADPVIWQGEHRALPSRRVLANTTIPLSNKEKLIQIPVLSQPARPCCSTTGIPASGRLLHTRGTFSCWLIGKFIAILFNPRNC